DEREVRPAVVAERDELAVQDGLGGQGGEFGQAGGHVPAASAADAKLAPAADMRAEAVPFRLEGLSVLVRQSPRAGEHRLREGGHARNLLCGARRRRAGQATPPEPPDRSRTSAYSCPRIGSASRAGRDLAKRRGRRCARDFQGGSGLSTRSMTRS